MTDDPVLRALEKANPVPHTRDVELPPLGPLPRRRPRTAPVALAALLLALATVTGLALAPSSTPGGNEVLARAFAGDGATILHWRVRTDSPDSPTWTDDLWMHVRGDGTIDRVRELRLDGEYTGLESVLEHPYGLGELRGAVTRTRAGADRRIRTAEGMGMPDFGFTGVIAAAERAARGTLEVGAAREVDFEGREAYEILIKAAKDPIPGYPRNPSQVSVTLWLERDGGRPLAIRWGEGAERWRTAHILTFERLPVTPDNRALLDFGS